VVVNYLLIVHFDLQVSHTSWHIQVTHKTAWASISSWSLLRASQTTSLWHMHPPQNVLPDIPGESFLMFAALELHEVSWNLRPIILFLWIQCWCNGFLQYLGAALSLTVASAVDLLLMLVYVSIWEQSPQLIAFPRLRALKVVFM
jgi:hypothetical protein